MQFDELKEAEKLKQEGLYYFSAVKYSLAFHRSPKEPKPLNPNKIFSADELIEILSILNSELKKIERVLSHGSRWNDDEFILVYTFLMEYKLLSDYFKEYKIPFDVKVDTIHDALLAVQIDKVNKVEAEKAKKTIIKNRKDLSVSWLNEVLLG